MDVNLARNEAVLPATLSLANEEQQALSAVDEDRGLSFAALTEKYYRRIYTLICYQIGDQDEAADLTQETFIKAFRAYQGFKGDSRFSTWLWRIALNLCKSSYRKRARREQVFSFSLDADVATEEGEVSRDVPDWSACPEKLAQTHELQQKVRAAIRSLPDPYRAVIILCDIECCAYLEIADILGISVPAVKSRIHRGRRMLRERLDAYLRD